MEQQKEQQLTPAQENYCQRRAEGMTQRQAYRAAYPRSVKWRDNSVDKEACKLEANPKISRRLKQLLKEAAERAIVTREEVINGVGTAFRKVLDAVQTQQMPDSQTVNALNQTADRCMKWLPEDTVDETLRVFDFGKLLSRDFVDMHRWINAHTFSEYWMPGGRGSLKTTTAAEEIIAGVSAVRGRNAVAMRNHTNKLRESVYAEMQKAAKRMDCYDDFTWTVSPMQAVHNRTGNIIYFFGADNANPNDSNLKSFTAADGYIAYLWFEEASQFPGYDYIRSLKQTFLRGGGDKPTWTFITYNPPISTNAWVNKECNEPMDGRVVVPSHWEHAPKEWLGEAFAAEAYALKKRNLKAYQHEYDGIPVGTGANVIDPAIIKVRTITKEERARLHNIAHGVDAGTVHPWVHERVAYDAEAGILYVLNEHTATGSASHDTKTAKVLAKALHEYGEDSFDLWCDSAAAGMISYYQEYGLNARNAYKQGVNSPKERVRWFNRMKEIVIDPNTCPMAAEQFPAYEYVITKSGDITDTLPGIKDDAVDAVGYAASVWIRQRM